MATQKTIDRQIKEAKLFQQNPSQYLLTKSDSVIRLAKKGLERIGITPISAKTQTTKPKISTSKPKISKPTKKISKSTKVKIDTKSNIKHSTLKIGKFSRKTTSINFTFDFTQSKSKTLIQNFSNPLVKKIMSKLRRMKLNFNNKTIIQLFSNTDYKDKNGVIQNREGKFKLVLTNSYKALEGQLLALFNTFQSIAKKYSFIIEFMDLTIDYIQ